MQDVVELSNSLLQRVYIYIYIYAKGRLDKYTKEKLIQDYM